MRTKETTLIEKKLNMLETFIDNYIDAFGLKNCIQYLLDNDFTKDELIAMDFDEEDIDKAIEEFDN
jgi:hypothetical protein